MASRPDIEVELRRLELRFAATRVSDERAVQRLVRSAVLKRWTSPVRRCNTSRALCSTRWGAAAKATAQVVRLPRPS